MKKGYLFSFLLLFLLQFSSCKKILNSKLDKVCFIPYIDFMAYNVNPDSLKVAIRSIVQANGNITYHRWDTNGVLLYQTSNPTSFDAPPFDAMQPSGNTATKLYIIKYTARNECGEAYWTDSVQIGPCLAKPLFMKQHLNDSVVRFTNGSTSTASSIVQYRWDFTGGNANFDNSISPSPYYYSTDGNYTVLLRVRNACGYNTYWDTVNICRKVAAAQQVSLFSTCSNYKFDASGSKYGYMYKWDFGDGTPAITQINNPIVFHQFNSVGNFNVKLTVSNLSGCDTKTLNAIVSVNPVNVVISGQVIFNSDDLVFNSNPVATQSASGYNWFFSDGTSYNYVTNSAFQKVFNQPGIYQGKYKAFNNCSSDSITFAVSVPSTKVLANLPTNNLQSVVAISASQIFYLGANGNFYSFDPQADAWINNGLIPVGIDSYAKLAKDKANNVWVYGTNGAGMWTGTSWITYSASALNYPSQSRLIDIDFDNSNNLWSCGTNNQLHRWADTILSGFDFTSIVFAAATNRIWFTDPASYNNRLLSYSLPGAALSIGPVVSNMAGVSKGLEIDPITNNLYFSSNNGFIRCDAIGNFNAYFNSILYFNLGKPDKIAFDNDNNIWCLFSTTANHEFVRLQKSILLPDPKLYNTVPEINFANDFSILNIGGTDNDIFLAKNNSNAAVRVY